MVICGVEGLDVLVDVVGGYIWVFFDDFECDG